MTGAPGHAVRVFTLVVLPSIRSPCALTSCAAPLYMCTQAMLCDYDEAEAMRVAEEDWLSDTRGASSLGREAFYDSLFEVCAHWCSCMPGPSPSLRLAFALQVLLTDLCLAWAVSMSMCGLSLCLLTLYLCTAHRPLDQLCRGRRLCVARTSYITALNLGRSP